MATINALQVKNGDCFLLMFTEFEKPQLLIIDSGFSGTFRIFESCIIKMIDTYDCDIHMVLTHTDSDHINGYKCLFRENSPIILKHIVGFYYNTLESIKKLAPFVTKEMVESDDEISDSNKTSYSDAITLEKFLKSNGINVYTGLYSGEKINFCEGLSAKILSPSHTSLEKYQNWVSKKSERKTSAGSDDYSEFINNLLKMEFEEDGNPVNASSISFLLNSFDHKMLFLGDSFPSDVVNGLRSLGYSEKNKLYTELVKVSHHGSKHNTSPELLKIIDSKCFLISGQGGKGHPDKETLARIVRFQNDPLLWFNYDISEEIFTSQEINDFKIRIKIGTEKNL